MLSPGAQETVTAGPAMRLPSWMGLIPIDEGGPAGLVNGGHPRFGQPGHDVGADAGHLSHHDSTSHQESSLATWGYIRM